MKRKAQNISNGSNMVEKKLGWLKSISSLSVILPPTRVPVVATSSKTIEELASRDSDDKGIETANVQELQHLPHDMVLRKSVTIEANFDLREYIKALRRRHRVHSAINLTNCLWKFEVSSMLDTKQDSRHSNHGLNKKSLQGDMLWLKQQSQQHGRGGRGVGEEESGDSVRGQVMCWQEALESLTTQYFQRTTPLFYILGTRPSSFRAIFYQKPHTPLQSTPSSEEEPPVSAGCFECVIHRCTTGMFQDLKSLEVPMKIIGAPGTLGGDSSTGGASGKESGFPPSYKEREKLNLFSDHSRKSKNNTTDRIIHVSGSTALQAVIDVIVKFALPLNSTSYYRVAADLPRLVAQTAFLHGTLSECVPSAYTCAVPGNPGGKEGEGPAAATVAAVGAGGAAAAGVSALDMTVDLFHNDFVQKHDRIRTLQLTGDMTSFFIEELAVLLRECGQQQQNTRPSATLDLQNNQHTERGQEIIKLNEGDINPNIFKIDKSKLKIIDDFAVSFTVLNPFKLSTSNPLESTAVLIKEAQQKKNTLQLKGVQDNNDVDEVEGESWNFFTMKLNSSLSDFNFAVAQTINQLHVIPAVRVKDQTHCCQIPPAAVDRVQGGTVVTDVAWYEEDGEDALFEVSLFSMPELSSTSVVYEE